MRSPSRRHRPGTWQPHERPGVLSPHCVLVVEDTASTGKSIAMAAEVVARRWPNAKIINAAVYATTSGSAHCDLIGRNLRTAALFGVEFSECLGCTRTWPTTSTGSFARNARPATMTMAATRNSRNAVPEVLPRKYPVRLIITARLEKWRPQTEARLRRHSIAWKELAMGPWPSRDARRRDKDIDKFKAYVLAHSSCYGFVESDIHQARSIMELARKPVASSAAKEFFIPRSYSWKKMSRLLK